MENLNNSKLARWQGKCYHVSDWGQTNCKYCGRTNDPRYFDFDTINPDYLNDNAAAMSLLDTLVEKGYEPCLEYDVCKWMFAIWKYEDSKQFIQVQRWADTIAQAITQAVLELIEKEA